MPRSNTCETYTPCFDWVIEATGCQATALTYGVVWRYAQMANARCYASCSRLAAHLAWSRQSVMRHLQRLLARGLIRCPNPEAPGVTRQYVPVSREAWLAARGTSDAQPDARATAPVRITEQPEPDPVHAEQSRRIATTRVEAPAMAQANEPAAPAGISGQDNERPVASRDTPCHKVQQGPVTTVDTRNTTNKPSRQHGTAARRDPRLLLLRKLTGRWPPAVLESQILSALGAEPETVRLGDCYRAWCARGYNPMNYAWLFDWYARRSIPPSAASERRPPALEASPESFARWHAYQQAIQEGESPDEARRRLDL